MCDEVRKNTYKKHWNSIVVQLLLRLEPKDAHSTSCCTDADFPRNNTKSPTLLMAATRRALLTKVIKAFLAEEQKFVP